MIVCTVIYVLLQVPIIRQLEPLLALQPIASGHFMPWQLVTYAFLHHDMLHLAFNMLGLWQFGTELERMWGAKRYMQLIGASILSAAIIQLGWTWVTQSYAATVGISGAVFGLLMAFGMMFPNRQIMLLLPPVPMKAKVFVAIFGGLELLMAYNPAAPVAHLAHLGGMLGAYLLIRYWRSQNPFGRRR